MSNYHVLKQAPDIKTAEVIFHIPIPAGNNSAGISWQAAIVKELGGADAITSRLPGITTEELSALYTIRRSNDDHSLRKQNDHHLIGDKTTWHLYTTMFLTTG